MDWTKIAFAIIKEPTKEFEWKSNSLKFKSLDFWDSASFIWSLLSNHADNILAEEVHKIKCEPIHVIKKKKHVKLNTTTMSAVLNLQTFRRT